MSRKSSPHDFAGGQGREARVRGTVVEALNRPRRAGRIVEAGRKLGGDALRLGFCGDFDDRRRLAEHLGEAEFHRRIRFEGMRDTHERMATTVIRQRLGLEEPQSYLEFDDEDIPF